MTNTEEQIRLLLDPQTPEPQLLETSRRLIDDYPFFLLPAIVALKRCRPMLTEQELNSYTLKVALSDPQHVALFDLLCSRAAEFRNFYPPETTPSKPTTVDAIDTFLQRYGGGRNNAEETELLERLIFNPMPDYASVLEQQAAAEPLQQTEAPADSADARIDEFLRKFSPEKDKDDEPAVVAETTPAPRSVAEPSPDSLLSESLAKFHIRRKQYAKALEIISGLAVSHPAKSEYYDIQIRFLKKLIRNQQLSQN
ncbi:MAG: hypothetical protein K2O00_06500 [Muribaculaceae bacterium]|nr:hypothetical protein [Muribaculaceae bacterium]